MTNITPHPDWDTLNAYVDGVLPEDRADRTQRHLAQCAECRRELEELQQFLTHVRAAPAVAAPEGLWMDIHASIENATVAPTRPAARMFVMSARMLAAAAMLLVAVTALATVMVTGRDVNDAQIAAHSPANSATPLRLTATDREYLETVEQLEAELKRTRSELQPATVAMVERSLATIDMALAEARDALLADPASTDLREVLESTYRQKVDFLKRAMQIASQE